MKILAVADEESASLWDYYEKGKLDGIDLIVSCGDLDPQYLSFLATVSSVPVLYVHGNHDCRYGQTSPEGCICIEDKIYVHEGLRILGLGGSMRYKEGAHQYTEWEMRRRAAMLVPKIFAKGGFDILVAHAPAFRLNDGRDLPHQGFRVFLWLMEKYRPRYFVHGHVHLSYGEGAKRYDRYLDTCVVNACGKCVIRVEGEMPGRRNFPK